MTELKVAWSNVVQRYPWAPLYAVLPWVAVALVLVMES